MFEPVAQFFGLEDDFVREPPRRAWLPDTLIAALLTLTSIMVIMANREIPEFRELLPLAPSIFAVLSAGVLIALRRRFPISVLVLVAGVHFIATGVLLPLVSMLASQQVLYFLALYTGVAFAKRRDTLLLGFGGVVLAMLLWLVVSTTRTAAAEEWAQGMWYLPATIVLNVAFFGTAATLGRASWLQAKTVAELAQSNALVQSQAEQLADRAVLQERLRIARDLHDSVAHYISLIGIQTAAARRAMLSKPEAAQQALLGVEEMSRNAVAELRALLGSLREGDAETGAGDSLDAIRSLCAASSGEGLTVLYELVGDPTDAATLSPAQTGALTRITQEAITNTRRHSTARQVRVVVRLHTDVELEITDDGRPVRGTGGSGLGLVGMRERVFALGGTIEAGPRATRGFRVLVRLPRNLAPAGEMIDQ